MTIRLMLGKIRKPSCRFEWTSTPITSVRPIRENLRNLLIMAALFRGFLLLVVLQSQGMLLLLSDPRCGYLRPVALHPVLLRHPLDSFLKCLYLGRILPRVLLELPIGFGADPNPLQILLSALRNLPEVLYMLIHF